MGKTIVEYNIPIQSEEQADEYNNKCKEIYGDKFTPLKSTDEHVDILLDKLMDAIEEVGNKGVWYLGDGIKVKIELEYDRRQINKRRIKNYDK